MDVTAAVQAAGGVVGRRTRVGREVLIVHRPRYQDWSLPKGKLNRGEHPVAAAVREVREETGVPALVGVRLPSAQYETWSGDALVAKHVDYWAMTPLDPDAVPEPESPDEVDGLAWTPAARAMDLLSYGHDRRVLRAYLELPELCRPVLLVRHASAGDRKRWTGPDEQRPLDPRGQAQAAALAALLPLFGIRRLVSARPVRCRQTLAPLSESLSIDVEIDGSFDEDGNPGVAAQALRRLADSSTATAVCSQGGLIPHALTELDVGAAAHLGDAREPDGRHFRLPKGDAWALHFGANPPTVRALDAVPLSR